MIFLTEAGRCGVPVSLNWSCRGVVGVVGVVGVEDASDAADDPV
jgi:hypothetical protein